jgi:hypothetical protein
VNQEHCERIQRWFQSSEIPPGLILPNGWFGQPHDNQHQLTFLTARKHKVLLELDDLLLLSVTELGEVRDEGPELVLTQFTQLVFDWQGEPLLEPHAYLYRSGEVRFVRPVLRYQR